MVFVYFSPSSFTLYQMDGVLSSGHAIVFAHFSVYQRLDTFIYHRKKSNKTVFFLFKERDRGWMNELNECIALLWVSGSLCRRNGIIFCTYYRGGLINTFSIYFIHTFTIESLHCLCVGMADLFHSKTFFWA